ncbi:hypothetical protein AB0K34_41735 [Actinomadura sp. NPDC049382]
MDQGSADGFGVPDDGVGPEAREVVGFLSGAAEAGEGVPVDGYGAGAGI